MVENDRLASWGYLRQNGYYLKQYDSNYILKETREKMQFHYVTVTGIYINGITGDTSLRVQSWGEEYYIDYNEFYNYNKDSDITWSGDLIFVQ